MRRVSDATSPRTPRRLDDDARRMSMAAHRNAPQPDPVASMALIGDVARAGSDGTETNPTPSPPTSWPIFPRSDAWVYSPIGNTWHHAGCSVCTSGVRAWPQRRCGVAGAAHRSGAAGDGRSLRAADSSRRPSRAKDWCADPRRLTGKVAWTCPPSRTNGCGWSIRVRQRAASGRRDGNTLSAALRDCWDGVDLANPPPSRTGFTPVIRTSA